MYGNHHDNSKYISPITGVAAVCTGLTTTLSNAITGGTWSSTAMAIAPVGSSSGIVAGLVPATATISYTLSSGCARTIVVTVNPLPAAITGPTTVCIGLSASLTDAGGGTWASSNTAVASVGSLTGMVTGINTGLAIITYKLSTGCIATTTITVLPPAAHLTGATTVCTGLTTTLSHTIAGGTWTSSTTLVATVGSSTGIITGIAPGFTLITYTLPTTGCLVVATVTVAALPASITGKMTVCVGATTALTDAGGGTWTSGNTTIAKAGVGSGVITGVSPGTATITYSLSTGCIATAVVTVDALPAALTGPSSVCTGLTIALSDAIPGGVWTSSSLAIASIGSLTGVVTGIAIAGGLVNITYTIGSGCYAIKTITVNPAAGFISGVGKVCTGATTALSDAGGGTWTSSNTATATVVLTSGIVTGITPGTATITYTLSTGCAAYTTVTVFAAPAAITGATGLCVGITSLLSSTTPGGIWSSSATSVATITSIGVASGLTAGSSVITYKVFSTGCVATATVAVSSAPGPITGSLKLCAGSVSGLSNPIMGGTWTSGTTSVATIDLSTGITSGISTGTSAITYSLGGSCRSTATLTVNPALPAITGTATVCVSAATTLSSAGGGSWATGNTAIAITGLSTGMVTGIAAGTTLVTYTHPSGCNTMTTVTVNPLPAPISGIAGACTAGGVTTLSSAPGPGSWSSSNTTIAVAGSTGIVTGALAGTATITYQLSTTGCAITATFTVYPLPSRITGAASVCPGSTTALSNTGGGTWASGATIIATIGSSSGIVNGIVAGTAVITYTLPTGCTISRTVTVNPLPLPISGPSAVCVGANISLTNTGGGVWASSTTSVATIGLSSGIATGVSLGTSTVTYTLPTGCITTSTVTVTPTPTAISGPSVVCAGTDISLSNTITGGSWTCSNTSVATAGITTGMVHGIAAGTTIITYSLGTGCTVTGTITVNPAPASITGVAAVCEGVSSALSDATPGGVWSSSNTTVATISGAGVAIGISAGTATITYSGSCYITTMFTVNAMPVAILGAPSVCHGSVTTLSDAIAGGTWSSSSKTVAAIGSITGNVKGLTAGTATITYTLPGACIATAAISVNPLPASVTGPSILCMAGTVNLSDATTGGMWSSDNTAVATVGGSGLVAGIAAGTAAISYTLATGCEVYKIITVNTTLPPISGPAAVCTGSSITLTNATGGGSWSSSNPSKVPVSALSGIISGIAAATTTITYSIGGGCTSTALVTVNATPPAIAGTSRVCEGLITTLSNALTGGTWSSADTKVSVAVATGDVTGISAGTAVVSYELSGCSVSKTVTIDPLPAVITGGTQVCVGSVISLTDLSAGGAWTSSAGIRASVGKTTGVVAGLSAGTSTIVYTLPTGCVSTLALTVNPLPAPITGPSIVCGSLDITLSDAAPGGTWASGNTGIAKVGVATGIVSGVSGGGVAITYTLPTSCLAVRTVTVNPAAAPITGLKNMCNGGDTIAVTSTDVPKGIWTSSVVTVTTGGLVTAYTTGIGVVTYTLPTGCFTTASLTVSALPGAISGAGSVCTGAIISLSDTTAGGTWTTLDTTVTIPAPGIIRGLTVGTAVITYSLPGGCKVMDTLTVFPTPDTIIGAGEVCVGATTVFTDVSPGGTWASSAPGVATADIITGAVAGVSAGPATITYTSSAGCFAVKEVSVMPLPALYSVSGGGSLCAGDPGVHVLLSKSATGINYHLYNGSTLMDTKAGTGVFIDFGPQTMGGAYTVIAENPVSTCTNVMVSSAPVIVNAKLTPGLTIVPAPGNTVCEGTLVAFNATPVFGGSAPVYTWKVNGIVVGAGGPTYSYTPVEGDVVIAMMTSDERCVTTSSAYSYVTMSVAAPQIPVVSIIADPGTNIGKGESVTWTAGVVNGGLAPGYQWQLNKVNIPGATNSTFTSNAIAHNDVINCLVTAGDICGLSAKGQDVRMLVSTTAIASPGASVDMVILPNPNNGTFTITGSLGVIDEEAVVTVTNMLGQVVYRKAIVAENGHLAHKVELTRETVNGTYLLTLTCGQKFRSFHVVVSE